MDQVLPRAWENLIGRVSGPMRLRLVLQPAMAAVLAIRAGLADARRGRRPYFWAIFLDPANRREMLREGWKDVAKVFLMAIVLDLVYQLAVLRWVYPGEALVVAATLALLPYLLIRGLLNRIARPWHRATPAPDS